MLIQSASRADRSLGWHLYRLRCFLYDPTILYSQNQIDFKYKWQRKIITDSLALQRTKIELLSSHAGCSPSSEKKSSDQVLMLTLKVLISSYYLLGAGVIDVGNACYFSIRSKIINFIVIIRTEITFNS
jgi:hypothetical protein